jgi:hypothetical protein
VFRKVDRLSCVRHGSARYSVPTIAIGTQVEVRVHHDEITVLTSTQSSRPQQLLACHPVGAPGEVSTTTIDYAPSDQADAAAAQAVLGPGTVLSPDDQLSPWRLRVTLSTDQPTGIPASTAAASPPPPAPINAGAIPCIP